MRTLRAAGAGLLLVLLVAGVPLALAATVGNPVGSWPDLLAGDVTDRVIIDILAAVACLAWAQFGVATAVELVSAVRRTPMPRPIPAFSAGSSNWPAPWSPPPCCSCRPSAPPSHPSRRPWPRCRTRPSR